MLTDAQLLMRIQTGDDASFETLFLRYYDQIFRVVLRLVGNEVDAEDIVQQVFMRLYHSPHRIRGRESELNLAGWLYRTAVNTGYNVLRSRMRQHKWYDRAREWWSPPAVPDGFERVVCSEAQDNVRKVLAGMRPRDAKLLLLRYSGLSYKELAAVLDVSAGSVGSLLTRAQREFGERYRQAFPEGSK